MGSALGLVCRFSSNPLGSFSLLLVLEILPQVIRFQKFDAVGMPMKGTAEVIHSLLHFRLECLCNAKSEI